MIQRFILKISNLTRQPQINFSLTGLLIGLVAVSSLLPIWANETNMTTLETTLEDLPTGQYYYHVANPRATNPHPRERGYLLLRKAGNTVIGIDRRSLSRNPCFRGFAEGDWITDATRVFPPYQPNSRLDFQEGEWIDLKQYQQAEPTLTAEQTAELQTCIDFFWR